ncbi:hypothetical protein EMCRGX_G002323 [Ephydatia muelleri]
MLEAMFCGCRYGYSLITMVLAVSWCGEGDTFLEHPATQTVLPGAIANFTCAFHCDDGVNYYFQVNENRIVDSSEFLRYDSECNEAETTCSLSIYLLADGSQNPNGSTVQCFVNCGGEYGPSEIAYLYIAGSPLAPNPRVWPLNATTLVISWEKPFSWNEVAQIYNYTIQMYNSSSDEMRSWVAKVRAGVTCYCIALEESGGDTNPCLDREAVGKLNQSYNNVVVTSRSVAQQCDTLVWYVSAVNALGKSVSASARGGFPIGTEWNFQQHMVAEIYYDAHEGTMSILVNIQLPQQCYASKSHYNITIEISAAHNFTEKFSIYSNSSLITRLLTFPIVLDPPGAESKYKMITSLQYLYWGMLYAANFSVELGPVANNGNVTTSRIYASIQPQTVQCIEQYTAFGVLSATCCILIIAICIIVGVVLRMRGQEGNQRRAVRIQHMNPIYTENQNHQYESLEKYRHQILDLRGYAN